MEKIKQLFTNKLFLLQAAFVVSLTATLSSLALSEIFNLYPCELCWYQRVLMYPLPFIFGAALARRNFDMFWYAFPMVALGALIAAYHYVIQKIAFATSTCGGNIVACADIQLEFLGFITIPLGSFSAFIVVGMLLIFLKKAAK